MIDQIVIVQAGITCMSKIALEVLKIPCVVCHFSEMLNTDKPASHSMNL